MRIAAAVAVLSAGAITSAQLSNIPTCSAGLVEQVVPCVKQACDVGDQLALSKVVASLCSGAGHPVSIPPVDSSAPISTSAGSVPTTVGSSYSTTVSGLGNSPQTSSEASMTSTIRSTTLATVNTESPSSTSLSNGASGIGYGAAQYLLWTDLSQGCISSLISVSNYTLELLKLSYNP
ncbi:predicted protein [Aspergillus terreus NIH2624]|uniref:Extracellular membrane protein CFEM domain-containing protein n=1 Tax=Aspergillus terreus (strain NIH 2624 / FGSC A1156) TaxID=341663 RepID=Q0CZ97_ASPTN|nr:uncharacterized protein ATEG_00987 [Aspergillus terreus NIH2624]EAU37744.1 predicted protein [Aspergillus terreus NIH2624]